MRGKRKSKRVKITTGRRPKPMDQMETMTPKMSPTSRMRDKYVD